MFFYVLLIPKSQEYKISEKRVNEEKHTHSYSYEDTPSVSEDLKTYYFYGSHDYVPALH